MTLRVAVLSVLAVLALSSAVYAAQPLDTAAGTPSAALAEPEALATPSESPAVACSESAATTLPVEPLADVLPQNDCGSGHPVSSCSECDRFVCFCNFISLCCYC